ncbi:MAG TPA: hypothetical protein VEQ58_03655 [Polyangiaceae bacterium]|nr:hypothetical protein [Polyangiaceae bacterium]
MLMLSQDGSLEIDKLEVDIVSADTTIAHNTYRVPQEAQLPATLAIVSNGKERSTATITVVGWHGQTPLDRRDAIVTQIPVDRVAALRVVLSGRCSALVASSSGPDGPIATSTCEDGQTCEPASGACEDAAVDASSLPNYASGDESSRVGVGGAPDGGDGGDGGSGGRGGTPEALGGSPEATGGSDIETPSAGGSAPSAGAGPDISEAGAGGGPEACPAGCTGANPVCLNGACVPCSPSPTPTQCRSQFPQYCDETGHFVNVAAGKCLASETCEAGSCECNGVKCDGVCKDTDTDTANCGSCGHVCAVGSCSAGKCTVVSIATGVSKPTYIAVGGGWLYWLARGEGNGKIYNRELSTSTSSAMVIQGPSASLHCTDIAEALWATDNFVYWTSYNVCLKTHGASANSGSAGTNNMYGGTPADKLGMLTAYGSNAFNISMSDAWVNSTNGSVYPFRAGTGNVTSIAADAQNLYWLQGNIQGAAVVYKHAAPALDDTPIELASTQSYSEGIAVYGGFVYWTAAPSATAGAGSIMRVSTSGGTVSTVASGQTSPSGIAVDASGVYWTNRFTNGSVMRAPLAGGTPVALATAQNGAHGIALDATTVYWTNTEGGQVQMVSK